MNEARPGGPSSNHPPILPPLEGSPLSSPIPVPSDWGESLEERRKGAPTHSFAHTVEALVSPLRQHLWPRKGWGLGKQSGEGGRCTVDSLRFPTLLLPLSVPTPKLGAGPGSSDWLGDGRPAPPLAGAGFLPALLRDGIKGARASGRSRREFLLRVGAGGTRSVRPRMSGR